MNFYILKPLVKYFFPFYFTTIIFASCQTSAQTKAISLLPPNAKAIAAFAEGCFWCSEHIFEEVLGVDSAVSGYAGGKTINPTYQEVGGEMTGHAETVLVYYDPQIIGYDELVKVFFSSHDPTTPDQQGPDKGSSYRSIAFYQNISEKNAIQKQIETSNDSKFFINPIVTEVLLLSSFYRAEEYHQNYIQQNPNVSYVQNVSLPRFELFKKNYKGKLKND
jgi:peptide-methionine (S)-S-oxide reductase